MTVENEVQEPGRPRPAAVYGTGARPLGMPSLSWGAVFAGLFVVLAVGWLLELLGVAIGVSIADAADSVTMGGTLTPAVSLWLLLCWLVSFFLGGLVTARLAGRIDDTSGMLHGLTLWAVATVATVALTYYGMSVMVNAGVQTLGVTAKGVGTALSATASGTQGLASGAMSVTKTINQKYGDAIQQTLYDRAAELVAAKDEQLSEQDVRQAVQDLDERTLRRVTMDLANDDSEGAAELIAENTELTMKESRSIVDSAYKALEERFGNPENDQSLSEDLKDGLIENVDSYFAAMDQSGGPRVTEQDIQQALNQVDAATAQSVAMRLVRGDVAGAKRVLAQNSNLTQAQITDLVDGATERINDQIAGYQEEVDEAIEVTSTYTAQILWVIFAGAAAALAAAIGGGCLGADSSRRVVPHEESKTNQELITHVH